jgi:hypothetical protein
MVLIFPIISYNSLLVGAYGTNFFDTFQSEAVQIMTLDIVDALPEVGTPNRTDSLSADEDVLNCSMPTPV